MPELTARLSAALADRYKIERHLGEGGMATVYLAEDLKHERRVAIKVLRPELAAHLGPERFIREVRIAARLQHPHILPLFDSGEADGFLYYVMPYIEGESLRERLDREGELPVGEASGLLHEVVDALAHAHTHGVVHRDIKPDNVMLTGRHAMVTDFGIAKAVSEAAGRHDITTAGVALGTPSYMAPEQAAADSAVDHRADIYAVGALAYELLTGRPPFTGSSSQAILAAHITQAPAPVSSYRSAVPPALEGVVMRCLEKKAADRWQTAEELLPHFDAARTPSGGTLPVVQTPGRGVSPWLVGAVTIAIVATVAVVMNRGSETGPPPGAGTPTVPSIAVLPFANVGGNPDDEYFADGMTHELIAGLGKVEQLSVAAPSSAFQFKGRNIDAREAGRQLNVATVLEGTVRRSGNRLRLSASLVDVVNGLTLWSDSYTREDGDAFALQDDLTAAIVSELRLQFGGIALATARAGRTSDPVAHDLYLRGRYHLALGTEADLRRSVAYNQQALARDPDFALAYAGLGLAHAALADAYVAPTEAYVLAADAAREALERDSLVALAHALLGYSEATLGIDAERGIARMRRAIELDPNAVYPRLLLGLTECFRSRTPDGLALIERAIELDPLDGFARWARLVCFNMAHRFEDAIQAAREPDTPDFFYLESWSAAALRALGQYDDALLEYRRIEAAGGEPLVGLAMTLAGLERADEARRILERMEERARAGYFSPALIAGVYASLGDAAAAVRMLRAAVDARDMWYAWVVTIPEFDELRDDPRVKRILQDAWALWRVDEGASSGSD